jgi:hypothetical protein
MDTLLSRHLPIITNRREFFPQDIGPPPIITPRIDFAKRLPNTEQNITTEDAESISMSCDSDVDGGAMDINTPFVIPDLPAYVASDSGVDETADLIDTVNKKIPKPRGQVGHPGSGGYSLDFVLRKWGSTLITDVNVSD